MTQTSVAAEFQVQMEIIEKAVEEAKAILDRAIAKGLINEIEGVRAELHWLSSIHNAVGDSTVSAQTMRDTLCEIKTQIH